MSDGVELPVGSVVVPASLFERMSWCYYGWGPRYREDERPAQPTAGGVREVGEEEVPPVEREAYNTTREALSKPRPRLQRVEPLEE